MGGDAARDRLDYLSYLLRLWRVSGSEDGSGEEETVWRASLESSYTGERIGFASLEELFEFLRRQTGMASELNDDRDEAGE
jgi:hypothetical protein